MIYIPTDDPTPEEIAEQLTDGETLFVPFCDESLVSVWESGLDQIIIMENNDESISRRS